MNDKKNILLALEFEGTKYSGWQKQDNALSVSQAVTAAVERTVGEKVRITGCGRTDAGVHAFNYICNFMTDTPIPAERICNALNSELPADIACKYSKEVSPDFHSRFSALSKRYVYMIQNTRTRSALYRNLHYFFPARLDEDLMQRASAYVVGRHDFRTFMASGSRIEDTVRTIYSLDVVRDGDMVEVDVRGDGFLYNMVRILAGTLIDIGIKKIDPDAMKEIIASKDRKAAGKTAPAHGLYLVDVEY